MKPSGLLLVVLGAWVVAQVLAGNALDRLGLAGASSGDAAANPADQAPRAQVSPKNPPSDQNVPHDGLGRPL